MDTNQDLGSGEVDVPMPSAVASLDVEAQAMFERVRLRLGMRSGGPEVIGRYVLRDWIGRGGMGQVYQAYDAELDRDVALKLIAPQPGSDPEILRRRLRREAQLLAKLDHDNVVKVYDVGVHEGQVHLVMELVRGPTLRELQTAGSLAPSECLRLYAEAGRGLAAAHERGVVHRDFKAENVFVGPNGRAKVGDFGLADLLGTPDSIPDPRPSVTQDRPASDPASDTDELSPLPHSSLTRSGEVLGTLVYMAPEQLRGEPVDARADQYAFCVAVWEALTGERPFAGASARALLASMEGEPQAAGSLDARLRKTLERGLAEDPARRHPDLQPLVAALDELRGRPGRRRRRVLYGLLALVGALVPAMVGYGVSATQTECVLAERVVALRTEHPPAALAPASSTKVAADVSRWLNRLEDEASEACRTGTVADRQHVESLIGGLTSLVELIEAGPAPERLAQVLADFELDFVSKAAIPLAPEVHARFTTELEPLEHSGRNLDILEWCERTKAESRAWSLAGRAELLLRCARVASRVGPDYEGVVASFKQARRLAEQSGDDSRRLEANLSAASTTITRLQDYDRGDELLEVAHDGLEALGVGVFDPRRVLYDELAAIRSRQRNECGEALRLQLFVVMRRMWSSGQDRLVAATVNLANAVNYCGMPIAAEFVGRVAVALEPDNPEALVVLGTFLVNENRYLDEAQRVCSHALNSGNHDLRVYATLCLMTSEIGREDRDLGRLTRYRDQLTQMLRDPEHNAFTPTQAAQGWANIVLAHVLADDEGPGYAFARTQVPAPLLVQVDASIDYIHELAEQ